MTMDIVPICEIIEPFKAGKPVIMVDDSDRENEGDIVVASEFITAELISFMMREARGLICITMSASRAEELGLTLQVANNNSPYNTAFTISVDCKDVAANGVEAESRAKTIMALIDSESGVETFVSPGHVFPLIADSRGVLGRRGQTEGSLDLARLCGLQASAIICEILNPDGSIARGEQLLAFANKHDLAITSVEEVVRHRIHNEILVRQVGSVDKETAYGTWKTYVFEDDVDSKEHLALVYGSLENTNQPDSGILTRIHSECLTGDVFGSRRCDCGDQLKLSMQKIVKEGAGIIIYLRQEGRGIGLANKLRAYELQDLGADTVEANVALGFAPDERDFGVAAKILQHLKQDSVKLLTNNPDKVGTLTSYGINIVDRVPLLAAPDPYCSFYLETKKKKLGHLIDRQQ